MELLGDCRLHRGALDELDVCGEVRRCEAGRDGGTRGALDGEEDLGGPLVGAMPNMVETHRGSSGDDYRQSDHQFVSPEDAQVVEQAALGRTLARGALAVRSSSHPWIQYSNPPGARPQGRCGPDVPALSARTRAVEVCHLIGAQ